MLRPTAKFSSQQRYSVSAPLDQPGAESAISGVSPGNYGITVQCFGAYARSASWGAQDLGSDPILTVLPGVAPPPIQVVATYGGGKINGKLKADPVPSPGNITVLLVPQFASPAGTLVTPALPDPRSPNQFQFQFQSLAPGAYSAWAFATANIEYRNSEFLRTLSGGTAVQVDESGEKDLTLNGLTH